LKRVIFSIVGTVLGLVALLSFKTHAPEHAAAGGLPAASLTAPSAPASSASRATTTSAPPDPNRSTSASTTASATRTVTGTSVQTRYGIVQVKAIVAGRKIMSVSFVQLTAFDGRSQQINANAGPILLQQTLSAQSAHIDGVSGATYTSTGYKTSLQAALDQVGIK
jgi:uncharacterized protein with FMN-binding domain